MPQLNPQKPPRGISALRRAFFSIHLVDRCLIFIMAILLAQSAYHLFANEFSSPEASAIDIIVRTTSAAIFGYFLSSNFIKCDADPSPGEPAPHTPRRTDALAVPADTPGMTATHAIGFAPPTTAAVAPALGTVDPDTDETSRQQIVITTLIGAFSLIVLLVARNSAEISPTMLGTLSQLRDFVAGSVGFLIGSPCVMRRL